MSKKILSCVMLLATGFLMNSPSMAMQSESPIACNPAGATVLVYGDHTTGCGISPSTELDIFQFDGIAGDVIRISLRTTGQLDGHIELFGPGGGAAISDTACGANGGGCSLIVNETLAESGQYGFIISDSGSESPGSYTLQLERIPPLAPQPVDYGEIIADGISPTTDMDFFVFNVNAGNTIRVTARTTGQLDGRLELWDPNGVLVIDTACGANGGGCTVTTDQSLTVTGTYLLAVSDSGIESPGNYDLSINCIFGPCPGIIPPRPECDIQLSQATYIDGETLTADVFRLANHTGAPIALETKIWVGVTGGPLAEVINQGADGSAVFPDGFDFDQGPSLQILLPFTAELTRGDWELSCRLLNPSTGRLLMEDRNFFELQ